MTNDQLDTFVHHPLGRQVFGAVIKPYMGSDDTPRKVVKTEAKRELTEVHTQVVDIEFTPWFSMAKKLPGQPGVYEVNGVAVFDDEPVARRFSYHNGRYFGPVRSTPAAAFAARLAIPTVAIQQSVKEFRGLVEASQ